MRILNVICGIAVLLSTIAFAHLLHHHFMGSSADDMRSFGFLTLFGLAALVGVFSLIGGVLLLRRPR